MPHLKPSTVLNLVVQPNPPDLGPLCHSDTWPVNRGWWPEEPANSSWSIEQISKTAITQKYFLEVFSMHLIAILNHLFFFNFGYFQRNLIAKVEMKVWIPPAHRMGTWHSSWSWAGQQEGCPPANDACRDKGCLSSEPQNWPQSPIQVRVDVRGQPGIRGPPWWTNCQQDTQNIRSTENTQRGLILPAWLMPLSHPNCRLTPSSPKQARHV